MQNASFEYRQKKRLKAAAMFAEGKDSYTEISQKLGVSRTSICKWHKAWEKEGEAGLVIGKPGSKPQVTDDQWQEIQDALLEGPRSQDYDTDLWTLELIADLIEKRTGIKYHPGYVWYLLSRLGWSYQKPEKIAKQRNEEEIARWKVEEYPLIKRGHKRREQG
jgi:transposase